MNVGSAGLGIGKIVNLLFLGYSSRSFAVFHLHLCRDNVGANGWSGWILPPFWCSASSLRSRTGLLIRID